MSYLSMFTFYGNVPDGMSVVSNTKIVNRNAVHLKPLCIPISTVNQMTCKEQWTSSRRSECSCKKPFLGGNEEEEKKKKKKKKKKKIVNENVAVNDKLKRQKRCT